MAAMIFTRHSVLKRGCSVWHKEHMPEEEFQARLAAARQEMARSDLDALLIYGDNYSFGDLCYLTNYFPKVRGGLALVPRSGPLCLLLNIGSRDVPFAKTLTWVVDVRASSRLGADAAGWLREKGLEKGKIGLVDSGQGFPISQFEELKSAAPAARWQVCRSIIEQMRLKKSPRELAALRAAGKMLREVADGAAEVVKAGRKEYEVIADIDRLARDKGIEDICLLGGEKRLQPPSFKRAAGLGSHWAVYLAVQHERYWAECGRTYLLTGDAKTRAAYQKAQDVVADLSRELRPGATTGTLVELARAKLAEIRAAAPLYGLGNGIGLSPWEAPFLSPEEAHQVGAPWTGPVAFDEAMTLALRVAIESEEKLILFGDTFEVGTIRAQSLVGN